MDFRLLKKTVKYFNCYSNSYKSEAESGLKFDPTLNINWPISISKISQKDLGYLLINLDFKGVI
jgi:dTDP-4-dehydrorhamnose 3,5-epimerase-like enzyme